jgi:hypothetical protein
VIHCDQSGSYAVQAYHAAVNGTPRKSERLESVKQEPTGEPHDHGHGSE